MTAESNEHFVLVHGGGHGAWSWYKLSTLLTSAGHQVTAIDLAACGVHPKRINEIGSFHDYTRQLMDLMASLPPHKRVILVGYSFNGVVLSLDMERFLEKISVAVFATAMMPTLAFPPSIIVKEEIEDDKDALSRDCRPMVASPEGSYTVLAKIPPKLISSTTILTSRNTFSSVSPTRPTGMRAAFSSFPFAPQSSDQNPTPHPSDCRPMIPVPNQQPLLPALSSSGS
ncbi:probable esterase PIR7A [Magnolia sinica]|uniref:probable esterase PIR7A n=1 Tax=Magnolia sinica TaxID=86752 RepID=UPI002658E196|nr:probable esterase PIR7A [Magnolia sinica]